MHIVHIRRICLIFVCTFLLAFVPMLPDCYLPFPHVLLVPADALEVGRKQMMEQRDAELSVPDKTVASSGKNHAN